MSTDDHDAVRARRERMLLRLLLRGYRSMNDATISGLNERGHDELRPSFTALLGNLDTEGTRLGALARRMGVSRQATSQLLSQVEAHGLVSRHDDPDDQRGVIVRFTPRGRRTLADAIEVMTGLEQGYRKRMGARDYDQLNALLRRFVELFDDGEGTLGLD